MKMFNKAINFCNTKLQKIAFALIMLLFTSTSGYSVTVNSLSALLGYLDDDNVNVVMSPGTYTITTAEVESGVYGPNPVLEFSGNNSTYDFTGVTLQFETGIFELYGWDVIMMEIQVSGNNNILKNLTTTNLGELDAKPDRGGTNLVVDGQDNLVQGFHMTVKGSYPYGYGDAFGKGGPYTIKPYKRCAVLVRGNRNHVKGFTIMHRAYGHAIYMQGAVDPIIENCYIEGEVRKTDDMLAETSGPAYDVDFMTSWGYTLPAGYMMSLGEDGIRTYASGNTKINGSYINQNTNNVTILNNTIKFMRSGVAVALSSGTKYIEGCTAIGCEAGFTSTEASFINCSADVTYGPIFKNSYEWTRNLVATLTILPPVDDYYNGSNCVAYFGGDGPNNITLNYGGGTIAPNAKIQMGGYFNGIRFFNGSNEAQNDHISWNYVLNNFTNYPVHCPSTSKDSEITSCGSVDNEGSGNTVTSPSSGCPEDDNGLDAFSQIEAEDYTSQLGIETETTTDTGGGENVGWINDGNWLRFDDVDFGSGVASVKVRVASSTTGGTIQFRLGSTSGSLIGTASVPVTGGWQTWTTVSVPVSGASGTQDLVLLFTEGGINVNWFEFSSSSCGTCTETNIALCGTATQSSTIASGDPARAIDGNTSGVWGNSSVTHTDDEANAWWELDLGCEYAAIGDIVVYNRTDCCKDRLTNFTVSVLNESRSTTFSQSYTSYPNPSTTVNAGGATGQYIRIQLDETNPLSLAEVEVYEYNGTCNDDLPWSDGDISVAGSSLNYSETVDISCASSATISMDIEGLGTMEPSDYLNIYYKVDGGSQQALSENVDDFSNKTVSATVSGNSVELIMNIYNSASTEIYNVSNISIMSASNARLGSLSEASKLSEVSEDFLIYPNPVSDRFTISSTTMLQATYSLIDNIGKTISKGRLNDGAAIVDVSGLKSGIYFIKVDNNQRVETRKIIIE